jgi:hypothetical protein
MTWYAITVEISCVFSRCNQTTCVQLIRVCQCHIVCAFSYFKTFKNLWIKQVVAEIGASATNAMHIFLMLTCWFLRRKKGYTGWHLQGMSGYLTLPSFWETRCKCICSHTCIYTHTYECTHAHPTSMNIFRRLSRRIGSWNWRSHHRRLVLKGNIASHWINIPPYETHKCQIWGLNSSELGYNHPSNHSTSGWFSIPHSFPLVTNQHCPTKCPLLVHSHPIFGQGHFLPRTGTVSRVPKAQL